MYLVTNCQYSNSTIFSFYLYYYSVSGQCPLAVGSTSQYPANFTYTATSSGTCADLYYTSYNGTYKTPVSYAYTVLTCNAVVQKSAAHSTHTTNTLTIITITAVITIVSLLMA